MHDHFDHAAQTGRRVALASIVASVLLATLNIVVGIITRSTSVVATGVRIRG
jgi:divalent metal cation (Fe/Co/Zn/Cd) transporter